MRQELLMSLLVCHVVSNVAMSDMRRQIWDSTPQASIQDVRDFFEDKLPGMTLDPAPTIDDTVPESLQRGRSDNYTLSLWGWVTVPETGIYKWGIFGDDEAILYVSTDETIGNFEEVASAESWTGFEVWDKFPAQTSASRFYTQGQILAVFGAYTQRGGGDYMGIGWAMPRQKAFSLISDHVTFISPTKPSAGSPEPADGTNDLPWYIRELNWAPGQYAQSHNVYFGTSFEDVRDGLGRVLIAERVQETTLSVDVELATTYYWRVDEVNAAPDFTVFGGDVWQFTVEDVTSVLGNVSATSDSQFTPATGPEKIVDGSGLLGGLHDTDETNQWQTASLPATVTFDLVGTQILHAIKIWNQNQVIEGLLGLGAKDITLDVSSDGTHFTTIEGVGPMNQAPGAEGYAANTTINLNDVPARLVRMTINSAFGPLPQSGLAEVQFLVIPTLPREFSPADDAITDGLDVRMSWRAGRFAAEHQVLVSKDRAAVEDGSALIGTTPDKHLEISGLDLASTYFNQVIDIAEDGKIFRGPINRFHTPDWLAVDDFEDYADIENLEIWATWIDGFDDPSNGSLVGADPNNNVFTPEEGVVRSGRQSLPLWFDNTAGLLSEATRTFASPQDWTRAGIRTLTLYVGGDPDNVTGQLFFKVNESKIVFNGDIPVTKPWYTQWIIDLDSLGTSLTNIRSLGIGIEGAGAQGVLYVDDIRLHAEAPVESTALDPGIENLVARYALDNNADDASGRGNHGLPIGNPVFAPGMYGQAMDFDGIDDSIDLGQLDVIGSGITVSMWLNPEDFAISDMRAISKAKAPGTRSTDHLWMISTRGSDHVLQFRLKTDENDEVVTLVADQGGMVTDEWTHAAATWDGRLMRIYQNLEVVGIAAKDGSAVAVDPSAQAAIGSQPPGAGGKHWNGLIDDVRIYNRALTLDELLYVALGE